MTTTASQRSADGHPELLAIARACGGLAVGLGVFVLTGWWTGIEAMRTPIPGTPAMVPNTALMFLLAGCALLLRSRAAGAVAHRAAALCALATLAVAVATLAEYAARADLGFDRVLSTAAPGPPAPHTAASHLLIAAAVLIPARPGRLYAGAVEALALFTAAVAMLVLLGYPLGVLYFAHPFGMPPSIGMAVHTAAGLLVLAAGVLALRGDATLVRLLTSPHIGGAAVRRLLAVALVVIPLVAVLAVALERRGAWPEPGAVAVAAIASFMALLVALRSVGRRLDRSDAARRAAERLSAELLRRETLQRARLESVLAQLPEGVIVVDAEGRRVLVGGPMEDLAVASQPPIYDVRLPDGRRLPRDALPGMRSLRGEVISGEELTIVSPDGEWIPILASARPIHAGGQVAGSVTVFRDIRARKELERLRDEWTSIVAHDLRQPVNAIALNVEMLERAGLADGDRKRVLRMRGSVDHLRRMIDDLLDASAIESRGLTLVPAPLDLDGLLAEAAVATRAADRIRIESTAGLTVFADRMRTLQILGNLLANAVKYGAPESVIEVRADVAGGQACIQVANRGVDIPAEELPHLFARFARTGAARRSAVPGLGLGLYVCRSLVEAMGGRIWAKSQGGVTTFTFTLPLVDRAPGHRAPEPPPGGMRDAT